MSAKEVAGTYEGEIQHLRDESMKNAEELVRLDERGQGIREDMNALWPHQIVKRRMLEDELRGIENMKTTYSELGQSIDEELRTAMQNRDRFQGVAAEAGQAIQSAGQEGKFGEFSERNNEMKEEKVTEGLGAVRDLQAYIQEVQRRKDALKPWHINEKMRMDGKVLRAQNALNKVLEDIDMLRQKDNHVLLPPNFARYKRQIENDFQ